MYPFLISMNSSTYNSSHPPSLGCFVSSFIEKEDVILKDLVKQMKNRENQTPIIKEAILIKLRTPEKALRAQNREIF